MANTNTCIDADADKPGDDDINYNHLFQLVDTKKTFNDVGDPSNVVKTAIGVNVILLLMSFSFCMMPIPFMAPITLLIYIVSFTVLNIKFSKDFITAVYQNDNKQIRFGKKKYEKNTKKKTNLKKDVNQFFSDKIEEVYNVDKTLEILWDKIGKQATNLSMVSTKANTSKQTREEEVKTREGDLKIEFT
jgi:hypothetical protein